MGVKNTFWLPNACDPEIHQDLHLRRIHDIGFVGTLNNFHNPRRSLYVKTLAKNFNAKIAANVWLKDMAKIYSQSKIIFNISGAQDLNMRVFEAMACGGMLLTDYLPHGLTDLLTDHKHCVVYHSLKEAVKLAGYYLDHKDERESIAQNGQQEVLQKHTYLHRGQHVIDKLSGLTRNNSATSRLSQQSLLVETKSNLVRTYFYLNHPRLESRLLQLTKELNAPAVKLPRLEKLKLKIIRLLTQKIKYPRKKMLVAAIKKLEKRRIAELIKWCYYQILLSIKSQAFKTIKAKL